MALMVPNISVVRMFNTYIDKQYFVSGNPTGKFERAPSDMDGLTKLVAVRERIQDEKAKENKVVLNKPKFLIVHCSDSTWGTAREIRKWHMDPNKPGGPFADIGYHYVILNGQLSPQYNLPMLNGSIEVARWWELGGAHCIGYNDRSIGICGIAQLEWTAAQKLSLIQLSKTLCRQHGITADNVLGHCETESGKQEGKTCPNLDMNQMRSLLKREGL